MMEPAASTADPVRRTAFPLVVLATLGSLLVVAFAVGLPYGTGLKLPTAIFLGRFHPVLLHLPIGFLVLGALFEYAGKFRRLRHLGASAGAVFLLAALASVVAAVLGCLLAAGEGDFTPATRDHLRGGVALTLASLWLLPLRAYAARAKSRFWPILHHTALILTLGLLVIASHLGGNLTHGPDYHVKYMPDGLKQALAALPRPVLEPLGLAPGAPTSAVPRDAFHSQVLPAMQASCTACHNAANPKGGLRLDTLEALLAGGDSGPAIVPGKPGKANCCAASPCRRRTTSSCLPMAKMPWMPAKLRPSDGGSPSCRPPPPDFRIHRCAMGTTLCGYGRPL